MNGRAALSDYLRMKPEAGDRAMIAMLAGERREACAEDAGRRGVWSRSRDGVAGGRSRRTAVTVAKSSMTVTPGRAWNRWSTRPSKRGETWTLDGVSLNELSFFGGVQPGEAIYRERNRKDEPLPKFDARMLRPTSSSGRGIVSHPVRDIAVRDRRPGAG